MTTVLGIRFLDIIHWHVRLRHTPYDANAANTRFVIGGYTTALIWGIYSVIFFDSMDEIELAATVIIISSMAGGASTVLAGNKRLSISYALILLVPISITGLLSDEHYHQVLGLLGSIFAVVMFVSSSKSSTFTAEAVLLKNQHADLLVEKEGLLDELNVQNQAISQVNTTLEEKVKQRTQEIFTLSNIDPLTKLQNRSAFLANLKQSLEQAEQQNESLALLFVDLDGFKGVNDTHGHEVGDEVLIVTAQRLIASLQSSSSLCRWGGDEFLIALNNTDKYKAEQLAKDIIDAVSRPIQVDYNMPFVGATIGISMYPQDSHNESELIAFADTAMYLQKEKAKSHACFFNRQMKAQLDRNRVLKSGLAHAIDKEELFVVYQPAYNVKDGCVKYCEVLLRWQHGGELIPPDEFIAVAEQFGLIHDIGAWVLNKACQDVADSALTGLDEVSVNVSVAQLLRGNMVEMIESAIYTSKIAPSKLHIEVTESIFAKEPDDVLSQIEQIKALGVNISIDDFGKDYSSLSLLQSLSPDTVKIDRAFVEKLDSGGEAIIRATQYVGTEFNFHIVVEGIETKAQFDRVTALGVEYIQGYYLSKPILAENLPHAGAIDLTPWAEA